MSQQVSTGKSAAEAVTVPTGRLLLVACLCQLLVVLDLSIVNIALPSISDSLDFSSTGLSWVVNAYVLVFGGLLLLGGRIADLIGIRAALFVGLGVFAVASLAGGLAQNPGELVAARAVQGLAGALLAPVSLTMIMVTFTDAAPRQRALMAWAMVGAGGSAVGVLLGGLLTEWLSWRWVMFVNVPIVAVVALLAVSAVHDSRPRSHGRLDVPGAVLATAALGMLGYALLDTEHQGWGSARTISLLVVAAVLAAVFVVVEHRHPHPLVRLRIFGEGHVALGTGIMFVAGTATLTGFYFASLFLQRILAYEPLAAGACFLPFCAGVTVGSFASRPLAARFSSRIVVAAGLVVGGLGMVWFAGLHPESTFWSGFVGPSLVTSVGLGAALVTTVTLAADGVAPAEAGLVSGLLQASRQVGGSVGLAAMTAIAVAAAKGATPEDALARGYDRAFLVSGLLVVLAGVLAGLFGRRRGPAAAGSG